jgi:beta-galactosidase/evolved beta-galactosidase subunit alpha
VHEGKHTIRVEGDSFRIVFDTLRGRMAGWTFEGRPLVLSGPVLNFWRAPVDNDNRWAARDTQYRVWKRAQYDKMQHQTRGIALEKRAGEIIVRIRSYAAPPTLTIGFDCEYAFSIRPDGTVKIEVSGRPRGDMPHLPRIGLRMSVPKHMNIAEWYGRGPGESYADSKDANLVGRYKACVRDLYTPYIYPQENGNREDTRWAALRPGRGAGLFVKGLPLFNFSAHYFTALDFERAQHTPDLVERDFITLNLDYKQCGVGTGSCGPETFPQYRIPATPFSFALFLAGVAKGPASPVRLYERLR